MILPRHHLEHCPSTQIYHDSSYLAENYAMAAISVVAFAARYCVRLRILPIRNLQGDDWMGIAVLLFFLYLTCCRLVVYHLGSNTDYNVTEIGKLSDCQIERLVFGSKFQISAWYAYVCFLWGLKAMVIFLFNRLPFFEYQRRLLKIFSVVVALTAVAVILTISFGCRPFHQNWGTIPYPPLSCTSRTQNFYTTAIANILTDAGLLLIAIPMLWNLRVPLKRKIALTLLLCSGIFIISAAIIAVLMSLLDAHSTLNTNRWATREEIAGILAVNAPMIKPMFHRSFWRKDFNPHRARRPPVKGVRVPHVSEPTLVEEITRPAPARRLGVLSSVKSGLLGKSSRGTAERSSRGHGAQSESGKEIKEMEEAWDVGERNGGMVAYAPYASTDGPELMLPESMRGDSFLWPEVQAVHVVQNEKEGEDKSRGV
ncbi:uncharacterized protein RCC_08422 [Ramularia collo-cygni]|uniref:Rhodopsin domain-containing protein n=1 Tax=Ramularia collo-cygni TaxID=112498 RepID=A0A2D3UXH0_9PEZI|nr:uncharacterized protein RCC_08422 [Ramularia collo-cygni]CZT22717.1 uncharacterized protein RCC_08422 [Ramularia collo-cygni]